MGAADAIHAPLHHELSLVPCFWDGLLGLGSRWPPKVVHAVAVDVSLLGARYGTAAEQVKAIGIAPIHGDFAGILLAGRAVVTHG